MNPQTEAGAYEKKLKSVSAYVASNLDGGVGGGSVKQKPGPFVKLLNTHT